MDDSEDVLDSSYYIDKEGILVAYDMDLSSDQIRIIYETVIMFEFGYYDEAIERLIPVAENCSIDILPINQLVIFYKALDRYDKVIEWCKKAEDDEIFAEYYAWPKIMLGECYEKGLGVDVNLLEASHWYDKIQMVDDPDEEEIQERNEFFKRHPELLDAVDTQEEL